MESNNKPWICPCNGCKKAKEQAFIEVLAVLDGGGDAYTRIDLIRKMVEPKSIKKQ